MKTTTKLWVLIIALAVLSPLGLLLPDHCGAGAAWGEWSTGELQKLVGYVPQGLATLSLCWHAPLAGYSCNGWDEKGIMHGSVAYMVSALLGIGIVVAVTIVLGRALTKKDIPPGDGDRNKKAS